MAFADAFPACQRAPSNDATVLEFNETDEFYKAVATSLNGGHQVRIDFGGKAKIAPNSPMLAILGKATNAQELWQQIQKEHTERGREALRTAFAPALLEHQLVAADAAKASNNVVEPGTIVLAAVIALILSITTVAIADTMIKVPVAGDLQFELEPPAFHISFRPVDPHAAS